MTDIAVDPKGRLLRLVAAHPGISLARAAKRLQTSQSQLRRWLTHLGPAGAGLLALDDSGTPTRIVLTHGATGLLSSPPGVVATTAWPVAAGQPLPAAAEWLVDEVPVALVYNGISHVVMLATPVDLEDFAVGFSLSEDIVQHRDEVELIDMARSELGISLQLKIPSAAFERLAARQRGLSGRSGCGLCGTTALAAAVRTPRRLDPAAQARAPAVAGLRAAFAAMQRQQRLHNLSGAVHAAAALDPDGAVLAVREDIGRHNALDKVLGACLRAGQTVAALLLTSRASYELVHKAAQCGVPLLATVSGPSALAVSVARLAGLTLLGFARDDRYTVYASPGLPLPA